MKLKDLKKLLESASNDAEIKIENGEIVIIEDKPVEYKFNIGDKVKVVHHNDGLAYEVVEQCLCDGELAYYIKHNDLVELCYERFLELIPQDITERIRTFDDAFNWCFVHDNVPLIEHSILAKECFTKLAPDLVTFLVLRIIVTALNEGWEPKDNDFAYFPIFMNDGRVVIETQPFQEAKMPKKLLFRTQELAAYAANQFRDIYTCFLGVTKGGKK